MESVLVMTITITRTGIRRHTASRILRVPYSTLLCYVTLTIFFCYTYACIVLEAFFVLAAMVFFLLATAQLLLLLFSPGIHTVKFRTNKKKWAKRTETKKSKQKTNSQNFIRRDRKICIFDYLCAFCRSRHWRYYNGTQPAWFADGIVVVVVILLQSTIIGAVVISAMMTMQRTMCPMTFRK